jgi:hypothetical protein
MNMNMNTATTSWLPLGIDDQIKNFFKKEHNIDFDMRNGTKKCQSKIVLVLVLKELSTNQK